MLVLTRRHDALDVTGVEQALCELDGVGPGGEPVLVVVHEGGDEHRTLEHVPVGPVLLAPQHVHLQERYREITACTHTDTHPSTIGACSFLPRNMSIYKRDPERLQ